MGRQPARQRPRAHRRDSRSARRHRRVVQASLCRCRHRRADGHGEPLQRCHLQGRRLHGQRPAGAGVRRAEDPVGDGSGRRTRREDLRAVGRTRGHRNRRVPPAGRSRQAPATRHRLPVRLQPVARLRLPARPRSEAQRAAWRHLHGHDGQLPRADPHAGASRDGGRQPRGRSRDDGGSQLHARRRPGVGRRQALPHRSERSESRPLRSGLPFRRREPARGVLPRQVPRGRGLRRSASLRRALLPH